MPGTRCWTKTIRTDSRHSFKMSKRVSDLPHSVGTGAGLMLKPDIRSMLYDQDSDWSSASAPALKRYNEEQLFTLKLPGGSQEVCVCVVDAAPEKEDGQLMPASGSRQLLQCVG